MVSEKTSPFLVDAVKASASRFKETKNALEARQKELDARQAELESLRVEMDRQAERLRAEREEFQKEKEQVKITRRFHLAAAARRTARRPEPDDSMSVSCRAD